MLAKVLYPDADVKDSDFKFDRLESRRLYELHGQLSKTDFFTIVRPAAPFSLFIDGDRHDVKADQLLFIGPGRNIKLRYPGDGGFLITFTRRFYERSLKDCLLLNSEIFFDGERMFRAVDVAEEDRLILNRWEAKVMGYCRLGADVHEAALHNFVEWMLIFAIDSFQAPQRLIPLEKVTDQGIVNRFTTFIYKSYRTEQNVGYYAGKLNICPRRLSLICKRSVGKTAKEIIRGIVLKEALRYIRNTDMSIAEIAYTMGFTEESNFRHFVKKHTGKTPTMFRLYAM